MRYDILDRKDEILQWIREGRSKSFISCQLKCNYKTLLKYLDDMGISYSGNQGGKGQLKYRHKMTFDEYISTSSSIQSNKVRERILDEGIKPRRCECCGLSEWLGQPIPIELHHKDGDKSHNELSNYELLCPNCHAFTDSYRGKNCRK